MASIPDRPKLVVAPAFLKDEKELKPMFLVP
jgi:hypothetical protein